MILDVIDRKYLCTLCNLINCYAICLCLCAGSMYMFFVCLFVFVKVVQHLQGLLSVVSSPSCIWIKSFVNV